MRKALDDVCHLYIDENHLVFDLVPPRLNAFISLCYNELGRSIYRALFKDFMQLCKGLKADLDALEDSPQDASDTDPPLLPGLQDLLKTKGYMGGVGNGLGLHRCSYWLSNSVTHCHTEAKHFTALDALDDEDEPNVPLDAGSALWIEAFSSDEDEVDEVGQWSIISCSILFFRSHSTPSLKPLDTT